MKKSWSAARAVLSSLMLLALVANAGSAFADDCPDMFAGGEPPEVLKQSMKKQARQLCYAEFAVLHSGVSRTPLWAAEHLTPERMKHAADRKNQFHPEKRLPKEERAELADYEHYADYDRGHMAPAHDFTTAESSKECFTLANMVPQAKKLNEQLWRYIEAGVYQTAKNGADLYVVTGPIFSGSNLLVLNERVTVPTMVFKAVYDSEKHAAAAYLAKNVDDATYREISMAELKKRTGLNVFPGIPESEQDDLLQLPKPSMKTAGKPAKKP